MAKRRRYKVEPTPADRGRTHGDFVVLANPFVLQIEGIDQFAIVSNHHSSSSRTLEVACRVLTRPDLGDDTICADQTLRNAIGIPFTYSIESTAVRLAPLVVSPWHRFCWLCSRILGTRKLLMRVGKADPPDMEKAIARVPPDGFALLGIPIGEHAIVEAAKGVRSTRLSIRAYSLTSEVQSRRAPFPDRYLNPEQVLGVVPDIWPVYLDDSARDKLGVSPLDVVTVRRNVWKLFLRELRFTFLTFALGFLGLRDMFCSTVVAVSFSILMAFGLTFVNIRAQSGSTKAGSSS